MGKAFKTELAALPQTYKWALQFSSSKLASLMGSPGTPLYVVGSGGSLSAAHLAGREIVKQDDGVEGAVSRFGLFT